MIDGLLPQVCLAVLVVTAWWSVVLILLTPWRATLLGRYLFGSGVVWATWWTLIGAGTLAVALLGTLRPPAWLETPQAFLFLLLPVIQVWFVTLQHRARRGPLKRGRDRA